MENEKVDHSPLQATTRQQQALWNKYNPNSYPFIDFGNKYVITGPIYDPQVLQGKTWPQVAAALHNRPAPSRRAPMAPRTTSLRRSAQ